MFSIYADALRYATRQDRWSGYDHWRQNPRDKRNWDIERRMAEERARQTRRPGLL